MSAPTMMPNNNPQGNSSGNRPIQPSQDKVSIKSVGIGSAFKMGCGLSMLIVLIFGGISFIIWTIIAIISPSIISSVSASLGNGIPNGLLGTAIAPGLSATASALNATASAVATPAASGAASSLGGSGVAIAIGSGCVGYILAIFLYGLFGGIGAAIYAIFYNIVGRWFGGIEVELKR